MKMKRILCLLLCLALILCAGCGAKARDVNVSDIVYSEKLLSVAGQDQDGWIADLKAVGEDNYQDIRAGDDGTVIMSLTDSQKDYWRQLRLELLKTMQGDLAALGDGYRFEYAEDGTQLDFYYDLDLDAATAIYYVLGAEVLCACIQLVDGCDPDGWTVAISVYNSGTGKLVQSGSSDTGFSYTEEDWSASAS